jgi:hypothetical protein
MFQHVIDTERIFAYRAVALARKEPNPIPGFDENEYAKSGTAAHRNWKDMLAEWKILRQSTNMLFNSFTEEDWKQKGIASENPMSVNALSFIIFGHALHHLHVLKERYSI